MPCTNFCPFASFYVLHFCLWCSSSKNQKARPLTFAGLPGKNVENDGIIVWSDHCRRLHFTPIILLETGVSTSLHIPHTLSPLRHVTFYLSILFKLNIPLICPNNSRDENIVVRNTSVGRCWLVEEWNTTAAGVETALGPAVAGTADTGMLPPS